MRAARLALVFLAMLSIALVSQVSEGAAQERSQARSLGDAATAIGPVTGRPLPRFASLSSGRVNARTGPGVEYPIRWEYRRQNLPVMIVAESQNWRKIRDHDGDEGWVHHALLSGRRTFVVQDGVATLLREPHTSAVPVLRAEAGVMGELSGCDDSWCRVSLGGRQGYLPRERVWGIAGDE